MDNELKPCPNPWCHSHKTADTEIRSMEAPIVVPSRASYERKVSCPVCPLDGPWADTEAEAIAAWNTRPEASHDQGDLVEALAVVQSFIDLQLEHGDSDKHQLLCNVRDKIAALKEKTDGQ